MTRNLVAAPAVAGLVLCVIVQLAGCTGHHKASVSSLLKEGWTVADRPVAVAPGTEIVAPASGKFLFATSTDPKSDASPAFTMVLMPEFRASPPPPWSNPDHGRAIVELVSKPKPGEQSIVSDAGARSMTEPRAFVKTGVAYLWGRWPLIGTGWVSGAPSGNTTERSRVIVWIDDQVNPTVHRIFFVPSASQQTYTVQLENPVCPGAGPTSIVMTALSYVEIVEGPGGCKKFESPEPTLRESNGWGDSRVEQFWQTVEQ
jgi:hypothetical protein